MKRRNFLGAIFAVASAPAIVKAENLMKIFVPKQELILPKEGITRVTRLDPLAADFDGDLHISEMFFPTTIVVVDRSMQQFLMKERSSSFFRFR